MKYLTANQLGKILAAANEGEFEIIMDNGEYIGYEHRILAYFILSRPGHSVPFQLEQIILDNAVPEGEPTVQLKIDFHEENLVYTLKNIEKEALEVLQKTSRYFDINFKEKKEKTNN